MSTPLTAVERACLEHVASRRDTLVTRVCELVRTPSVNPYAGDETAGSEAAAQALMRSYLDAAGARTHEVTIPADVYERAPIIGPRGRRFDGRPCIVGEFTFGAGGRTLVINTHIDTVGAAGMTIAPFAGEVRDGAVWGRGASDSKGNLAMALAAVEAVCAAAPDVRGRVLFESVVDEECNGSGAGTLACLLAGFRGDAAVVTDGAGLIVTRGCGGVLTTEVGVRGRSGHAAAGDTVNAIEKALLVADGLLRFRAERETAHPGFRVNLGVFHAGTIPAVVPGEACMGLNLSYEVSEALAAEAAGRPYGAGLIMDALAAAVHQAADADDWLREHPPAVDWVKDLYPFATPEGEDLVQMATRAATEVLGRPAAVQVTKAWLDAAHLAVRGRMPVIGFGCGQEHTAHGPVEHLRIDQAIAGAQTLALLIHRFLRP